MRDRYIDETLPVRGEYNPIIYDYKEVGEYYGAKYQDGYCLESIFIDKEYRGKGAGRKTIEYILEDNEFIMTSPITDTMGFWNKVGLKFNNKTGFGYINKK